MANVSEENDPGMLIFEDVFRRADKNDVGAVSWDNFMSFFADGVMGKDELRHLFDEIDTHNTNNIDCGELCSYFSKHLGPFREIYTRVGELNRVVSDALLKTSGVYPESCREDKFVTRFLIREILNQFSSLQRPLEAAAEILDDQARQERPDVLPLGLDQVTKKDNSAIIPGRVVRRAKRQFSTQSSTTESTGSLALQVERLEALLDRFEHRVNFEGTGDEEIIEKEDPDNDDQVLLVKRTLRVKTGQDVEFRQELNSHITNTQRQDGCLFVSVRLYKDTNKFIVYEMWNSDDQRKMYESGGPVGVVTDPNHALLAAPPVTSTMAIPGQWWRK